MIGMSLHGGVADYSWSDGVENTPIPHKMGFHRELLDKGFRCR
jgi:hypothetical protein